MTSWPGTRQLRIAPKSQSWLKLFKLTNTRPVYPASPIPSCGNNTKVSCPESPHPFASWPTPVLLHVAPSSWNCNRQFPMVVVSWSVGLIIPLFFYYIFKQWGADSTLCPLNYSGASKDWELRTAGESGFRLQGLLSLLSSEHLLYSSNFLRTSFLCCLGHDSSEFPLIGTLGWQDFWFSIHILLPGAFSVPLPNSWEK